MDLLIDAEFQGELFANLEYMEEHFFEKEFDRCNFVNCNFTSSHFIDCLFSNCTFENCNLSMIHVKDSTFRDVLFLRSKVIGVLWYECRKRNFSLSVIFRESFIDYSSFFGGDLRKCKFENTTAIEVDFSEANLGKVKLDRMKLSGATFSKTNLRDADFTTATDYVLDPSVNQVKGASFSMPDAMNLLCAFGVKVEV